MKTMTAALFDDQERARKAVIDLRDAGVPDLAITLVGRDGETATASEGADADRFIGSDGDQRLTTDGENHTLRGVIGGGALGALLGVAALAIPGVGPFFAAGALATALGTGTILGAGAGGLREVLVQNGMDDEDAGYYEKGLHDGGVLVSVDLAASNHDTASIDRILMQNGGTRTAATETATA